MGVNPSRTSPPHRTKGQAIVEFAITLPVLLALLVGIFEFGRMIFVYAAITNASREAVRYASAIGFSDNTNYYRKYQYCQGIRNVAKKYGFLLNLQDTNITIEYDHGPNTTAFDTCPAGTTDDPTIVIKMGQDRAKVTVSATYTPMVVLFPISSRTFTSTSFRTIAGNVQVYP